MGLAGRDGAGKNRVLPGEWGEEGGRGDRVGMTVTPQRQMLEREHELARVGSALRKAGAGAGSVLLVEGPAGIGKTTLLDGARAAAAERGMRIVAARATELEREFSHGVVRQLVDPVLRGTAPERRRRLLDGADAAVAALRLERWGEAPGAGSEFAALHGLYWLFANLAEEQPLLVTVDDAHWADLASLRFLAFLGPRLPELPVLVLIAAREGERDPVRLFAATASDPAGQPLLPAPLSPQACATLVGARFQQPADEAFCLACHAATGGNPFFMHALLDELVRDGIAPQAATAGRVLAMGPRAVASAIVARLAVLSPAAAPLARAAAVLGHDARLEQATRLAGLDAARAWRAVGELVRVSILAPGDGLRFTHPIIRNAVYRDIGRDERDRLHRRAAEVLSGEGAPAERVAAQLLASRPAGDAYAQATLRQAAREALAAGAADSAVAYLRRALAEPPAAQEHGALLAELGAAELLTDGPASIAHLREALPLATQPAARAAAAIMLARSLLLAGRTGEAAATASEMLAKLGKGEQDDARRQLQATIVVAAATLDPSLAPLREQVVAHLGAVNREKGLGARMVQAALAFEDARRLIAPAGQLASRVERVLANGLLLNHDGIMAMVPAVMTLTVSDPALALTWLDRLLDRARRHGDIYALATGHAFRCQARLVRGELADAILDGQMGVDAVQRWGLTIGRPWAAGYLAAAQMQAGDLDGAERTLAGAAAGTAEIPEDGSWLPYLDARAGLFLLRGELRACLEATLDCARRFEAFGGLNPAFLPWRSRAARCLAGLGEQRERAAALAAEEVQLARRWGEPGALGAALHAQALVQGHRDGEALLREALQILAGSPARLEHARALVALGAMLRRQGQRLDTRAPLRSGLELARSCGATPLAERAYCELRATGASPRKLIRTGADTLTACERRVAQMATSGMSNKQIAQALFVTVKTVESHLAQSYRKLGISSRSELSSALKPEHPEA